MLNQAIKKARQIPYKRGERRVYCIITDKRGRVISEGQNSYTKTHPIQKHIACCVGLPDKEYLHSEIQAIIRSRGEGSDIYIARVDSKGREKIAKPCPVCQRGIEEHDSIENIYYTEG
jgi:tRNA(Arg) A34 adenosine deaminase TadA